jgi:hypothetical protein
MNTLMIADVWDETNIIIKLQSKPFVDFSLFQMINWIWLDNSILYRPLALSVLVIIDELNGLDFIYLRYFNLVLLISSMFFLARTLVNFFQISLLRVVFFFTLSLYSSSFLITAGWFANIFDALCLFFISMGILLMSEKKYLLSSILIGLSFYCKEISILIIPMIGFFLYNKTVSVKKMIVPLIIIVLFNGLYWYLRQRVIPLGSPNDIHGFTLDTFFPSFFIFLNSFWWQHTKYSSNSFEAWLGLIVFILSIISIKGYINKLLASFIVILSALAYWGMFAYQEQVIMNWNNFSGRLYLIPSVMVLYIISTKSNRFIFLLLAIMIPLGTIKTYVSHFKFQKVYSDIYDLARRQNEPLVIHYPEKSLSDPFRNIYLGNYQNSDIYINIYEAKLMQKQ